MTNQHPFKTLRGKAIFLDIPERKKSSIQLTPEAEDAMMKESLKLWTKLNIYAAGTKCEEVKEGDKVYVRTTALEHAEKIEMDGSIKLVAAEHDVILIW